MNDKGVSMQKLTYTGTAPGQAGTMIVLGRRVVRGQTYNVTDDEAARLLLIGGFEQKQSKRRRTENADQEQE